MGQCIRASVNRMADDADRLQQQVSQLPAVIESLESTMGTLASCWEGSAWSAFQKQVADDVEYMNDLYRFIMNYISHIESGRQKYLKSEQQTYSLIKGLSN